MELEALHIGVCLESQMVSDGVGSSAYRSLPRISNVWPRKLTGARWYIKGLLAELEAVGGHIDENDYLSERDVDGHGTHTASTAAGNFVGQASIDGLASGTARGGAPMDREHMLKPHNLHPSLHPHWSPAAMKSALVTTASSTDEYGGPIFTDRLPGRIADPFDYGGAIVNPNKAEDPGLIYDMGMEDNIFYLCSRGYSNSDISRVTEEPIVCPSKRPSALDMNLPTIAIPNLKSSVTISRTVTNVSPVNSVYKAYLEPLPGIHASVSPNALVFNCKAKKVSFTVTSSSTIEMIGGCYFGSLTWSGGVHKVRGPIAVRPEIIPFFVDDS